MKRRTLSVYLGFALVLLSLIQAQGKESEIIKSGYAVKFKADIVFENRDALAPRWIENSKIIRREQDGEFEITTLCTLSAFVSPASTKTLEFGKIVSFVGTSESKEISFEEELRMSCGQQISSHSEVDGNEFEKYNPDNVYVDYITRAFPVAVRRPVDRSHDRPSTASQQRRTW